MDFAENLITLDHQKIIEKNWNDLMEFPGDTPKEKWQKNKDKAKFINKINLFIKEKKI